MTFNIFGWAIHKLTFWNKLASFLKIFFIYSFFFFLHFTCTFLPVCFSRIVLVPFQIGLMVASQNNQVTSPLSHFNQNISKSCCTCRRVTNQWENLHGMSYKGVGPTCDPRTALVCLALILKVSEAQLDD